MVFWLLSTAQWADWRDIWINFALKWLAGLVLVWALQMISKSEVKIRIFFTFRIGTIKGTLANLIIGVGIGIGITLFTCENY
jgi:hypothetical protein